MERGAAIKIFFDLLESKEKLDPVDQTTAKHLLHVGQVLSVHAFDLRQGLRTEIELEEGEFELRSVYRSAHAAARSKLTSLRISALYWEWAPSPCSTARRV